MVMLKERVDYIDLLPGQIYRSFVHSSVNLLHNGVY